MAAFVLYVRMFFDPWGSAGSSVSVGADRPGKILGDGGGARRRRPRLADPLPHAPGRVGSTRELRLRRGRTVLPDLSLNIPAGQTVALVGPPAREPRSRSSSPGSDPQVGAVLLGGVDAPVGDETAPARDAADRRTSSSAAPWPTTSGSGGPTPRARSGRPAVGAHSHLALPDSSTPTPASAARACRQGSGSSSPSPASSSPTPGADPRRGHQLARHSERLVQAALSTVLADRTAIIIAHRLSTVRSPTGPRPAARRDRRDSRPASCPRRPVQTCTGPRSTRSRAPALGSFSVETAYS